MPSTPSSLASLHAAPPLSLLVMEPLRAAFDFCSGKFSTSPQPVGDGHPVVVYPGLGGGSFTTSHLRRSLDQSGFTSQCWGRGVNTGPDGDFDQWLDGLEDDVRSWHAESGRKVSLVGWSLGGIYARELAKRAPECVRQVVTMGTPFASISGATHAEKAFSLLNGTTPQITPQLEARLRAAPPLPTTSVYSKSDGVVNWRGCIQKKSALAESVEVTASHLGMGTHPEVLRVIVDRLAQPEGRWQPMGRRTAPARTVALAGA